MTQAELASKVGVEREDLNRIINREVNPTILLGMGIAKALNMPMEDLFMGTLKNCLLACRSAFQARPGRGRMPLLQQLQAA